MSLSSVVFVGVGFERQLFNERELFPEPLGRDYTAFGPVGEYTYGPNNAYRFAVAPDKIALHHDSETILSDDLMRAAGQVAETLQSRNQGHGVVALGFNFDTIFPQSETGPTGTEFCKGLCNGGRIEQAIGSRFHDTQCRVVVLRGGVRYTLRLEPHTASSGANLYLGTNAHQDVGPGDELAERVARSTNAREYIGSVTTSLSRDFEEEEK